MTMHIALYPTYDVDILHDLRNERGRELPSSENCLDATILGLEESTRNSKERRGSGHLQQWQQKEQTVK